MSKTKLWKQLLSASLAAVVAVTGIPCQSLAAEPPEQTKEMIANFTFDGEDPYDGGGAKGQIMGYGLAERGGGNALQFSGNSSGWLNVTKEDGSPLLQGKENITISYETNGNQWGFFLAPDTERQNEREVYVGMLNGNTVERYCWGRNNAASSKVIGEAVSGWTKVDVVIEETQTTLYLNGVKQGSSVASASKLSDILGEDGGIFQIGKANWGNGEYSNGQIDNFKVYDGALTEGQVTGSEDITQPLLADFTFDSLEEGFRGAGAVAEAAGIRKYSQEGEEDNYALNLTGLNGWMKVTDGEGNPLLTGLSEMTLSYDSYIQESGTSWVFFAAPNEDTQTYEYEQYLGIMNKDGEITVERYDNEGERPGNSIVADSSGTWEHVDVVFGQGATTVYVDGVKVGESESAYALEDILGDNSVLQIGKANWNAGEYCNGMIDNLQIYNYAKSEAEIIGGLEEELLASYDFADFALESDGNSMVDDEGRQLQLVTTGSGTKPSLTEDETRGQVLQLNQATYANSGYALLPENPFEGVSTEDGLTLNFWTLTTGNTNNYGNKCLIDFEVAPATTGRAGTFAVNQQMVYWNTTDQNGKYIDFNMGSLGLSTRDVWKMVTIVITNEGLKAYCDGFEVSVPINGSYGSLDYEQMISDLAGGQLGEGEKSNVRLGASLATYWECAGARLDDVSFYSKALTEEEIVALYEDTKVEVPVTSITISGENAVDEGKTIQLTAEFEPENTTEKHVNWKSSDESILTVDQNGVVTGVGEGTAIVTAEKNGIVSNEFSITVNSTVKTLEEGYYLTAYSTTKNFYAYAANVEQETQSVYLAVSKDGKTFDVLNNGGGVIFSKNTEGSLKVTSPKIFKDGDTFVVAALDAEDSRKIHLFTSEDGVHYYDDQVVDSAEYDLATPSLNKDSFPLLLDGENILESDETITLGNALELTEEEYTYIVNKLGTVVNTGLESLEDLTVTDQADLEEKLNSQRGSVNATYSDGSIQKFNIDWSDALSSTDTSEAGTYTLTGQVVQTKYLNKLKELNGSTLPEDDPDNENPDEPDNYDEETGKTYYDETKFVEGMADPCIYWDEQTGYYYMTGSYFPEEGDAIDENDNTQQYDRIVLRKSRTLEGLQSRENQVTIWKVGNQGYYDGDSYVDRGYRYIWAPEIHRVGEHWVIYFTESHSSNAFNIYSHVLVLDGDKDPYETALESAGQASEWTDYKMNQTVSDSFNSLDTSFCLDMTYFKDAVNGQSYVIWAGKPTASYRGSSTDLFIAKVSEERPWEVTSAATRLTCSEYGWERIRYCVNEGATVLQHDGNIFMCYSVSGTGSEYAIGMMNVKAGEDLLDINNWTKNPYPLLTSRDVAGEEGPGHNSFTVDQDGNAIFVYHARPTSHNYQKCGCDANGNNSTWNSEPLNDPCRHARLKRVHWAADGTPILKMTYADELLEEYSTVQIKVTKEEKDVLLTGLEVVPPEKLTYEVGENLDTTGMTVTALYSDESSKVLEEGYEITGFDSGKAQEGQTITVSYTENGVTKTATFQVTIKEKEYPPVTEEDLIASFTFDGEEGLKGAGAVATVNGTAAYEDSFAGAGQAMSLSSSNWLNVTKEDGTPLLQGLERITISYDSKATSLGKGWIFFAAPNDNTQTYQREHYLGIMDLASGVTVERFNNSVTRPGNSIVADSTSEWKHVDLVIEEDASALYIDGVKVGEHISSYKLSDILSETGGIIQIGKGNWESGEYYNGLIDNLKIYNGAKTEEDLTKTDQDIVEDAKEALEIPNADDIRGNITLVDAIKDATVTWTSSDENIISTKPVENEGYDPTPAGVVNRGDQDQTVTLTATIQKGDATATKEFTVTVKKKAEELDEDDFTAYLFGSFTGTEGSPTDEQIYFAVSEDGYYYEDLNGYQPVLQSDVGEKGVRDPYLLRSAEGDRFYLIATDLSIYYRGGWGNANATTTGSRDLIVWETTDLVNWSEPRAVTVAGLDAGCAWAPEAIYDEKTGEYIVYFASNSMEDEIADGVLQIYYTKTRDFVNFTEAKEYITRGADQSIIDTTMIKNEEDGYYYRASADGQITLERSKEIFGTWETVTNLDSLGLGGDMSGRKLEGPELFKFNKKDWVDGKPTYGLYTDQYAEGKGYLPVITTDLSDADNSEQSWKKLSSSEYSFDTLKKRHGTILNLTQEEYERVMEAYYKELPSLDEDPQEEPVLSYDFEDGTMSDGSGNGRDGQMFGNATIVEDEEKGGKVLKLDGTADTYAELPQGFFDLRNTVSISMDVKAENVSGNYFTFTFGADSTRYLFLKTANDTSRVSMTMGGYSSEQTASGECGTIQNQWVNFTIVLDGENKSLKLYQDGEKIGETRATVKTAAMGEDLVSYLGKSFYSGDGYFNGCFDNVKVYNRALTDEEIAEANKPEPEKVTVTYTAGEGGSIQGETTQTIVKGESTTEVVAVADEGYEFVEWSDGRKTAARTDENVQESATYEASFRKVNEPEPEKVTVTYTGGEGGSIQGETTQTIVKGESTTEVVAVADEGYEFVEWSDGRKTAARTDENVQESATYEASFRKVDEPEPEMVTVQYFAGTGGRIEGETKQTIVRGESTQEVMAVPEEGYEFMRWSDGYTQARRSDANVQDDANYEAFFRKVDVSEPEETVTVTYVAGDGGRIEGTAIQTIVKGGNTTEVTAVANAGYVFSKWSDGVTTAKRVDQNVTVSKKVTAEFTKIQVTEPDPEPTMPEAASVKLNVKKKITIGRKEKVQLKATVLPANASQKVTWKSSKKSVVSVSANGKITGKKRGKAIITATAENGKKISCVVTVKRAPKKIVLKNGPKTDKKIATKTIKKGKSWRMKVKLSSKKTASYKLTFKSSNKKVATVNAKGKIRARKKGTAIITARTYNGKKVRIKIQVK